MNIQGVPGPSIGGKKTYCTDCRRSFPSKGRFNKHIDDDDCAVKGIKMPAKCRYCSMQIYNRSGFLAHEQHCDLRVQDVSSESSVALYSRVAAAPPPSRALAVTAPTWRAEPALVKAPYGATCKPPLRGYRPVKATHDNVLVTLSVGYDTDRETHTLRRGHLTSVSPFFEDKFKDDLADRFLSLTGTPPSTFAIFNEWLSARKLVNQDGDPYNVTKDGKTPRFDELLRVYIFATKYNVPQLRRDALDTFARYTRNCSFVPDSDHIIACYKVLPRSSPWCKYLANIYAYYYDGEWTVEDPNTLPREFMFEVLTVMMKNRADLVDGKGMKLCDYHEHDG